MSSYATGTLDLTANPNAGNTVQIGQQIYTFVASGAANAAGDVALGSNVQGTLQNLQNAVNGTGTASPGTYGVGTAANRAAQITAVNGGSATVQALTAGNAGNTVQLITNLTSSGGTTGANLTGAVNATNDVASLTLNAQPGYLSTSAGTLTMTALPDTLANATGMLTFGTQPVAGNATGTLTLAAAPANLETVTVGSEVYTFTTAAPANNSNQVLISGTTGSLNNLMDAVNGIASAGNVGTNAVAAGNALITSVVGNVATVAATSPVGATGDAIAFSASGAGASGAGFLAGGGTSDTVTVGAQAYTFVAAGAATAANQVALGANVAGTMTNLMDAVNGIGSGSDTTYGAGTGINGAATMSYSGAGGEATITAATGGVGGNAIALTSTILNAANPTGFLSGGAAADTVTIGTTTYTFVAAGQAIAADQVADGATVQATLTNLLNAVNGTGAASNTTYGTGTVANTTGTITGISNGVVTVQSGTAGVATPGAGNGTTTGNSVALSVSSQTGTVTVSGTGFLTGGSNTDTVTIGNVTYSFVAAGQANAANQVALGSSLQGTLNNLMAAVNSTSTAAYNASTNPTGGSVSTFGVGTTLNTQATITSDANGVAEVQALTAGGMGLNAVFGGGNATGTLGGLTVSTLSGGSATAAATGNIDLAGGQPTAGNATGTVNIGTTTTGLSGATVTIGGQAFTFESGALGAAGQVAIGASITTALTNLQNAVNGTGSSGANTYYAGTVPAGTAVISSFNATTGAATVAATSLTTGNAVTLAATGNATVSGGTLAGQGTSDTVTIGAVTYTFVAADAATAGHNEVALGATTQATLKNLMAAVNAANDATGNSGATFQLASNGAASIQGLTGAQISSVNGAQAVVTANAVGAGTLAAGTGNFLALSDTFANSANVAGSPGGATAATKATGLFDLTNNPLSGNTVTIGGESYTFVSGAPTAANQVLIGGSANGTLNNLMEAVNNGPAGTGAGTNYGTGTVANTSATITAVAGGQATVQAITAGTAGNSVAISAELSNGAGGGAVGTVSSSLAGGGASVSLNSAADAQSALTVIAGAISTVAATRGAIGSGINQMNAAVQVMNNTSQNLTSSLSGIQDANIGQVVANMSKYQVLEQTGIAALTQANTNEQVVLKLLP